ncbi:MAG: glycoside hydrolase family 16 protein [Cystobacter sp.]
MNRLNVRSKFFVGCCLATLSACAPEASDAPVDAQSQGEEVGQSRQELEYNPGSNWNLAWRDEFDGSSLNGANWNVLTSNWDPVTNNCNFGTGELEYPRAQNVTVGGGLLTLTAERTNDRPMDSKCSGFGARSFYSGRIHTKGKVERRYGKIVASIKVPSGYGMWPAFWTLGGNISQVGWPKSGEIDILEWHSNEPTWSKSATHWDANGNAAHWGTGATGGYNLADSFHIYELEWTASAMIFRVDGRVANATYYHNESEFQQNHYIILNLALGGNWYGDPDPSRVDLPLGQKKTMQVEWVRWYQPGSGGGDNGGGTGLSVANASFESGMSNWATWSPNGTESSAFSETHNGGRTGSYHLTHWRNSPFEAWTYQTKSGLANGNYKVRAWVRKAGAFNFSRIQAKTCGTCSPASTDLGNYSGWTQVETPAIAVTNGYLEFGFHSQSSAYDSSPALHVDDVELIKL